MVSDSGKRLTALATSTLSLLRERERLQATHPALHLAQIVGQLHALRSGVVALQETSDDHHDHDHDGEDGGGEGKEHGEHGGHGEAAELRGQYERLRGMLGEVEAGRAGLESIPLPARRPSPPLPPPAEGDEHERIRKSLEPTSTFEPYTDEPQDEEGILLQQREMIQEQDSRLDHLSSSIGRQHHISLQINDELEVHTGLLDTLDTELDGTDARMVRARRQLTRVARGAKENASTVTIGLLILVLLILIVVFKT